MRGRDKSIYSGEILRIVRYQKNDPAVFGGVLFYGKASKCARTYEVDVSISYDLHPQNKLSVKEYENPFKS